MNIQISPTFTRCAALLRVIFLLASSAIAAFASPSYTVTPSAGVNGFISPISIQTLNAGDSVSFTASPNLGYMVDEWLVNGSPAQSGGTSYTLSSVSFDTRVQVTFKAVVYTVTASAGANGFISPNARQPVNSGDSLSFTATPALGYAVDQWLVDGSPVQTGGTTYTLNSVSRDTTVQVDFKPVGYTVTPSAGANGFISPGAAQTVNNGASVDFTATPGAGFTVDQWLVNGSLVQTGGTSYTLNNVVADAIVQVSFKGMPVAQLTGSGMTNGVFQCFLSGPVGSNYVMQVTSDFVNWTPISTNTLPASGSLLISTPMPPNQPHQFYRALSR